ncbi:hypothetical protein FRB95_008286 [Tulasnella sp. JGI-2019a]|nr:hypothetical protein FRB95_008286 [Tulasnella sp. JGI-2019a]
MRIPSKQLEAALREWEPYSASAGFRICSRRDYTSGHGNGGNAGNGGNGGSTNGSGNGGAGGAGGNGGNSGSQHH